MTAVLARTIKLLFVKSSKVYRGVKELSCVYNNISKRVIRIRILGIMLYVHTRELFSFVLCIRIQVRRHRSNYTRGILKSK